MLFAWEIYQGYYVVRFDCELIRSPMLHRYERGGQAKGGGQKEWCLGRLPEHSNISG
jgi:hypothetical protein